MTRASSSPSWSSARAHARGLVLARGDDRPRRRPSRAPRSRRAARRARRRRSAGPRAPCDELRVERQARRRVEDDAARLAVDAVDARGELRVVGQRGADPDGDGVDLGAPAMVREPREASPEIHFESPVRVATLPSSVIADLKSTQGRPVRACLRKAWLSRRARRRRARRRRRRPRRPRRAGSRGRGRGLLARVVGADDDAADAGLRGSRPCTAACGRGGSTARARRRASRRAGRRRRRRRCAATLGVRAAVAGVQALADDLAVRDDDRADERVRAHAARPAGQLDGPRQVRWSVSERATLSCPPG